MKVRYTRTALAEIDAIFSYVSQHQPPAAAAIVSRIEQLVDRIAQFPAMAHLSDEPNVRVIPIGCFPYLIFYATEGDELVILHVRHAARLPPREQ